MNEQKVKGTCWGEIFRKAMEEQGISQNRMAKDLQMPLSTLQYRLKDGIELKKSVFEKMANYLKITI